MIFAHRNLCLRTVSVCLALALGVVGLTRHLQAEEKAPAKAKAATVAEAMRAIDLTTLPVLKGAVDPVNRSVARTSYNASSDCKAAFEFHQQQLLKQKWNELPGSSATDQYASGTFTRDGFVLSLSASPLGEPGTVNVSIMLHGNVDLLKLPIPKDLKPVYVGPQVAMYSTKTSVEATTTACHKLLMDQGWLPYGKAGDTQFFKLNAVRLTANISEAPSQMGETMVSYSAEQLSADVPAPVENVQLQYSDSTKEVLFDTKDSEDAIEKFYRDTLTKAGWKATTDQPFAIDWKKGLIFRNKAMDLFELEMYPVEDEKVLRVTVQFQTAAEVEAIEKAIKDKLAAEKNKPIPKTGKVKITIPAGAELTETTAKSLEFTVATGKGKAAAEAIRKSLTAAGWEEKVTTAEDNLGVIDFTLDKQEISLQYVDPGFIPAEISLRASGVDLEKVDGKK